MKCPIQPNSSRNRSECQRLQRFRQQATKEPIETHGPIPSALIFSTSSFVMDSFAIASSALILFSSRDDFIAASVSKNALPSTV